MSALATEARGCGRALAASFATRPPKRRSDCHVPTEIGSLDARIAGQIGCRAGDGDGAALEDVAVMGDGQRLARILLDEKEGRALGVDPGEEREDLSHQDG